MILVKGDGVMLIKCPKCTHLFSVDYESVDEITCPVCDFKFYNEYGD